MWEQKLPGNLYGGSLPVNINSMINDYRNLSRFPTGSEYKAEAAHLNSKYSKISEPGNKKVSANFTSTVIYPPWAYFPSLIGLQIAKWLHLPLIWYVYLARISNFLVWLTLAALAISLIPGGKWFMLAMALLPTSLSQAATIGGDGLQMGLAWLLIAITLAVMAKKLKPDWRLMVPAIFVAVYASLIKDGYFLLGLLPLLIPSSRFLSKKAGVVWKGITFVSVGAAASWFTYRTFRAVHGVVLTPTLGMNINSSQQVHYMLTHWAGYILHVIEQPFTKSFDTTYLGIVGILTNRLIYLSILVMALLFFGLYLGIRKTPRLNNLSDYRKRLVIGFSAVFVLSYGLLASAFYVGNTSVGATFVNGFYGRYFLPLLPLLLAYPLSRARRQSSNKYFLEGGITAVAVIGLAAMVMSIQ